MHTRQRQALLERARQGDLSALGELLQSYRPYIRVIVQAITRRSLLDGADDSDLIQDTMVHAQQGFPGFRGNSVPELTGWLRQIAIRNAGHSLENQPETVTRGKELLQNLADDDLSPSDQAIRHEQSLQVSDAIARLPDDMQRVLLGRHVEGLSHGEIALSMNRSPGAVRVLYVRALQRLRELLGATEEV